MASVRGSWGSRLGFVLAAAGSAVGLGNLWKFPYLAWENGGGAFVIVYLLAVVLLGLPIMMAEILIGRRARASAVVAFETLGGRNWAVIGWLGVASGGLILAYYTVIAGWSLRSFAHCLQWSFAGYPATAAADFDASLSNGPLQILLTAAFAGLTTWIVRRGIGGGIERANKVMMPVLLGIMVYLVATVMMLPGRAQGLDHLFVPRFDQLPAEGALMAVGQAFFSLSLGLGAMIAYGSYLGPRESIPRAAAWVVACDTAVAIMAGVVMFVIIHSIAGMDGRISGSTVGMLFKVLPELFYTQMPGGVLMGPLFFLLLTFAALTSTISLGEVVASLLIDRMGWSRSKATWVSAGMVFAISVPCALSLGAVEGLSSLEVFAGKAGVLSTLDHLAANWMLPLGGLGTTIFAGWFLGRRALLDELGVERPTVLFRIWLWLLRVVVPLLVIGLLFLVVSGRDLS